MRFIVAGLAGIAGSACALGAQAAPAPSGSPLLDQLVGSWRMVGQVRGHPVTYDLVARHVLNGRFVELYMKDVARPMQYEALVFIGADTLPNRVLVHWLDNFGAAFSVPSGRGTISGDTVQFGIPYDDGPFRDTFIFQRSDRSWMFRLEAGDGHGAWKLFAEYMVRPAPAPAQ
jgi:hypothetical protein